MHNTCKVNYLLYLQCFDKQLVLYVFFNIISFPFSLPFSFYLSDCNDHSEAYILLPLVFVFSDTCSLSTCQYMLGTLLCSLICEGTFHNALILISYYPSASDSMLLYSFLAKYQTIKQKYLQLFYYRRSNVHLTFTTYGGCRVFHNGLLFKCPMVTLKGAIWWC